MLCSSSGKQSDSTDDGALHETMLEGLGIKLGDSESSFFDYSSEVTS